MKLSREELLFFKKYGYLIKRNVLDAGLMEKARDTIWKHAPASFSRSEPNTWTGPFSEDDESEDEMNLRLGYRWKLRKPGEEEWMAKLIATDVNVWEVAEQLLGEGMLEVPGIVRGIYCTLPCRNPLPKSKPKSTGVDAIPGSECHVDRHSFNLGVVGYIDQVPPEGGGFMVWPGSHRHFYYDFPSQYRFERTNFYAGSRRYFDGQPYVECTGEPGDIVFWHHRLGHAVGPNYSKTIRQAVLHDFLRKDIKQKEQEPPGENMWSDWPGISDLDG